MATGKYLEKTSSKKIVSRPLNTSIQFNLPQTHHGRFIRRKLKGNGCYMISFKMSANCASPSETEVRTSKLVQLLDCNLENKVLLGGQLLKWMDIVACLAAEKHAKFPCVTASVDDLHIEQSVRCGSVVNMQARVNRAFNTSMEVEVLTSSEDLKNGEKNRICKAFFTFVTQPDGNGKRKTISPINPINKEENIQYVLASERKLMRLDYKKTLQEMKQTNFSEEYFLAEKDLKSHGVSPTTTICESVEIVLPQHANHHKTTFGGQLMAWMEATATISAGRLCHKTPLLISVDEVFFRAPSKVGDRAVITAMVNNTFSKSLEVGVRVEAYAVGGNTRHIESAYFTFIAPDEKGNPTTLPRLIPENEHQKARMARAHKRVKLRQERRLIFSSGEAAVSSQWTLSNSRLISYKSIKSLLELYRGTDWRSIVQFDKFHLSRCMKGEDLVIRGQFCVDVPASYAYDYLINDRRRLYWDEQIVDVDILKEIDDGRDTISHFVMQNVNPAQRMRADDFVMLVSRRPSLDPREPFTIAYRSVALEGMPPKPEYNRAENLCSGFLIEQCKENNCRCKITYINQLTKEVFEYVKGAFDGATELHKERSERLSQLLVDRFSNCKETS